MARTPRRSSAGSTDATTVAAVFDAYFSTYLRAASDFFNTYAAGGGQVERAELPASLANLLAATAARIADDFFVLCARAIDYCPPVDVTFGDFLRALITVSMDLHPDDEHRVRQALMQAFRVRGIVPEGARFYSEDALCWPRAQAGRVSSKSDALPVVQAKITHPVTKATGGGPGRWSVVVELAGLDLDLDVDPGGELEALERLDRLAGGLDDVDETLVDPHLEVLARVLVDVR